MRYSVCASGYHLLCIKKTSEVEKEEEEEEQKCEVIHLQGSSIQGSKDKLQRALAGRLV